jgi:hypothetical protein
MFTAVLRIRIRDTVLFFTPRSGIQDAKKCGSRMNISDYSSESFRAKILKFFEKDPDPGSGIFLTLDPGWKNSDPG